MKITRSVKGATNTCNVPAKPRVLKGYAADMSNVIGSDRDILEDDSRFDPPVDEQESQESVDVVEIQFEDVQITVLPDSTWDYKDTTYEWAQPEDGGDWVSESGVPLGDAVEMVEHIDDLIVSMVPSQPGDYIISGKAELYFNIEGVVDEDYDFIIDQTDVDYDYDSSRVTDFKCLPD